MLVLHDIQGSRFLWCEFCKYVDGMQRNVLIHESAAHGQTDEQRVIPCSRIAIRQSGPGRTGAERAQPYIMLLGSTLKITGMTTADTPALVPLDAVNAVAADLRALVGPDALPTITNTAVVQIRANTLIARLRALNRDANAAVKAHKQITADARSEMDHTHLGLQNLLYEKRHLEREIDKCRQFA